MAPDPENGQALSATPLLTEPQSPPAQSSSKPKPIVKTIVELAEANNDREEALIRKFMDGNASEFVIGEIMLHLAALKVAMDQWLEFAREATTAKDKLSYMEHWTNLSKEKANYLRELIKLRETDWHQGIKDKKKNRSAAPRQRVGPTAPSTERVTESP